MEPTVEMLNESYHICFDRLELMRDMGSASYAAFSGGNQYFLRRLKPAFFASSLAGADVQVFLQNQGFPVPRILFAKSGLPYAKTGDILLILYEFIEGGDSDPEQDAEAIGALVGRLHQAMKAYPGKLASRDKHFYLGRYIDILRQKQFPRIQEYIAYDDAIWEKLQNLPRGYCHGDLYDGNIRKSLDGRLFIHDFDTSCEGFPMYDVTLICDMTSHFEFDARNYGRSNEVLSRFVPEYLKYSALSQAEIAAFYPLVAMQHFSTQATVMEMFCIDCIDETDMDRQLDWLYRWREQCEK